MPILNNPIGSINQSRLLIACRIIALLIYTWRYSTNGANYNNSPARTYSNNCTDLLNIQSIGGGKIMRFRCITQQEAIKAIETTSKTIAIVPSKANPNSPWISPCTITRTDIADWVSDTECLSTEHIDTCYPTLVFRLRHSNRKTRDKAIKALAIQRLKRDFMYYVPKELGSTVKWIEVEAVS